MQIEYVVCLTRYALLLIMFEKYKNEFILTLTISLQNYCKFKATRNLFLTKAKIIKITPFNSLSLRKLTLQSLDNFNDLLLTCIPLRSYEQQWRCQQDKGTNWWADTHQRLKVWSKG